MVKAYEAYGKELILDLHGCDVSRFNRVDLSIFFEELCYHISMEASDLHFWDDKDTPEDEKEMEPHLVGTSAVQFIRTSNITIHALDLMKRVYLNIFSCKDFDARVAANYSAEYFGGRIVGFTEIDRQ